MKLMHVAGNRPFMAALVMSLAILLSMLVPARFAAAQGTSGTLPDPISTKDLTDYGKRLKLSDQQRQAAEKIHDQYKQEFRVLREGEIATFMKEMRSMQGGMMPKRQAVEDFMKRMDQLNGKINTLDNSLFDQLQPVLTEEQIALMPRIRLSRQRERYNNNQMMWMSGNRAVDLSEFFRELELTPDVFSAADALMSQYETKFTSDLGKLYDRSTKSILDAIDAMEKAGFDPESMQDPEKAQKAMEMMQTIWRDTMKKTMEAANDLHELDRRTFKSVAATLPDEAAREFRTKFYTRAYPEAGFSGGDDAMFAQALKLTELTDEQRAGTIAARDEMRRALDRITEDTVAMIDEFRKKQSPMDYNAETWQEHQKQLQELQAKAAAARASAATLLMATLGPELGEKLKAKMPGIQNGQVAMDIQAGTLVEGAVVTTSVAIDGAQVEISDPLGDGDGDPEANQWSGDQFLPSRITERELAEYADRLKLSAEQKTTLQTMHKDYQEKFKGVTDGEVAAVTKAQQSLWQYDEKTQTSTLPTMQQIDEVYRLRRVAMDAIRRVDGAFFDDVEAAVLEPAQAPLIKRVRLARERKTLVRENGGLGYWYGGQSNEGSIDLSRVVYRQKFAADQLAAIDAELAIYEDAATKAFRNSFDVSLEMQKTQERWNVEMQKAQQEGKTNAIAISQKWQESMGEASKKTAEAATAIGNLNRESLDKFAALLPADAAYALRETYNKKAFPSIYADNTCVNRQLQAALKLDSLTEEQRRALSDLAAEYHPAYVAMCDKMVQASSEGGGNRFMGYDAEGWKKEQERQEAIAQIQFDRNELNIRAINLMKSTLTPDQIAHIGTLPEPSQGHSGGMYGMD